MKQQSPEVVQRILESRDQNIRLKALLPQGPAPSLRANFARCAIDLALEHHSGLIRVAAADEFGTAGALLRPILEASTAAFWFMYVATCEEIRALPTSEIENSNADIPMLGEMAKALIPTFPAIQIIVDGLKRGGRAKWLHKYTHGGTPQLNRRRSGWSDPEKIFTLIRADMFGVLAACLETVITPNSELSNYGFGRRDALSEELLLRFGTPLPPEQPHALPSALTDGCGPAFG